jgi:rsbT antagonist protein RsbS
MATVPIVHLGSTLIATVQEELGDSAAMELQERLTEHLERTGATGVLLDMSMVETVDSFLGRVINDIARVTRLLGAQTVVVGLQPTVAITLVELGLELEGVRTALNPELGLALLRRLIATQRHGRRARGRR